MTAERARCAGSGLLEASDENEGAHATPSRETRRLRPAFVADRGLGRRRGRDEAPRDRRESEPPGARRGRRVEAIRTTKRALAVAPIVVLAALVPTAAAAQSAEVATNEGTEPVARLEGAEEGAHDEGTEADVRRTTFDLTAGTHFPISVGLEGQLELPARVLLRLHAGWMPSGYVDVINRVATGFDWYDQATADLVAAAIDHAFALRVGIGWRPLEGKGFELSVGYTLVVGGGSVTSAEAVEAASGRQVDPRGDAAVPMRTTLHAIHARLAWRWILGEHVVIRAAIGYVHTVHANTVIDLDRARAVALAEAYLDDVLTTYGLTPELQLTAGYRF